MIRNILIYILAAILLVSAAGIVVYHSYCTCTGSDHYSLYVTPETCTETYHIHHKHNNKGEEEAVTAVECHECNAHTDMCGCDRPVIKLYKLDDRLLNDNIRIEKVQPVLVKIIYGLVPLVFDFYRDITSKVITLCESPPGIYRSLDFLIIIQQLKIPFSLKG